MVNLLPVGNHPACSCQCFFDDIIVSPGIVEGGLAAITFFPGCVFTRFLLLTDNHFYHPAHLARTVASKHDYAA